MASPLYGVAAMNAIGFGVYGNVIRRLNNPDSIASITTAGVAAGAVQVSICTCKLFCDVFVTSKVSLFLPKSIDAFSYACMLR